MGRRILFLLLPLFAACKALDTSSLGVTQTVPLKSVDGQPLPASLPDGKGGTAQILSGSLTAYAAKSGCDWVIALASGKTISGTASCIGANVKAIAGGVELSLDVGDAAGPQGTHLYDFVTKEPCFCPKLCACQSQRSVPALRESKTLSALELHLQRYRQSLSR